LRSGGPTSDLVGEPWDRLNSVVTRTNIANLFRLLRAFHRAQLKQHGCVLLNLTALYGHFGLIKLRELYANWLQSASSA